MSMLHPATGGKHRAPRKTAQIRIATPVHDENVAAAFAELAAEIERCATALIRRCDERNIHALRVATRRARVLLWSLHPWIDEGISVQCARDLKHIAARLAPMRDLDVVARLLMRIARKAGLTAQQSRQLHARLAGERRRERRALRSLFQSAEERERIRSACLALRRKSLVRDVAGDAIESWRRRILRGVAKVNKRARRSRTEDLHSLRIRARRSRYALEFLGAIAPRDDLQRMAELHASLGRYCDARLAATWLKGNGESLGEELRKPLQRTARKIATRRARRVRKSLERHGCHRSLSGGRAHCASLLADELFSSHPPENPARRRPR